MNFMINEDKSIINLQFSSQRMSLDLVAVFFVFFSCSCSILNDYDGFRLKVQDLTCKNVSYQDFSLNTLLHKNENPKLMKAF